MLLDSAREGSKVVRKVLKDIGCQRDSLHPMLFHRLLLLVAVGALLVLAEDGVGNIAVRYELYRAVVVAQLLLGDDVRIVAMHVAVDTYDATHDTRDSADVVRHHNYGHMLREMVQKVV